MESACFSGSLSHCQKAFKSYEKGEQGDNYAEVGLKACDLGDKYGCMVFFLNAKVRSTQFWQNRFEAAVPAPEPLIELLRVDNLMNGYGERPVSAKPKPQFSALLKEALREIPPVVTKVLNRKLAGIVLVENLGSTAYNLGLLDENGPSPSSIIVLDVSKLTKKANAWASWKESTPFRQEPEFSLEVTIENEASDNVKRAIQYIVLHEMGHVLERAGGYNPSKDDPPDPAFPKKFAFLAQSWTVAEHGYLSRFDNAFPERGKIRFYAEKPEDQLPFASAAEIYGKLESTNFTSLYAATNPWDDFADSFAGYVHSVLQKRPYRVVLKKNRRIIRSSGSCWDSPRCKEKRDFFDRIFRR